jgi:hypothetical protein
MANKNQSTRPTQHSQMTSSEAKKFATDLKHYGERISASPSAARKLLASAGITTPKGQLKKPYR